MNNMINYKIQKQTRTIIDNITNKNVVELAEQNGLNNTNWLDTIKELNHEPFLVPFEYRRKILCDIAVKYAEPDVFAKNIRLITCKFEYADIIRMYMEQRIKKTNEQRKFLERCLAELNYNESIDLLQFCSIAELAIVNDYLQKAKQVVESLKQIVALSTTATPQQTPQVTKPTLTDANKVTIKEIVQKFNNDDDFKGNFDEQQVINCFENADFRPLYIDRQKIWVRGLICTVKQELPNIDTDIFTQITNNLGYKTMSELSKSTKRPFIYKK